jgi:hypothetical protein
MPRKKPKLAVLADRIATATRIIESQRALLKRLRAGKQATVEVEGALQTYTSSLTHLLDHADRMRDEAQAKKGETKMGRRLCLSSRPTGLPKKEILEQEISFTTRERRSAGATR